MDSILRWYQVDSASSLLPALKSATSDSPISCGVGPFPLASFLRRTCLKMGAEASVSGCVPDFLSAFFSSFASDFLSAFSAAFSSAFACFAAALACFAATLSCFAASSASFAASFSACLAA
jgi:hypothetical protein